MTNALGSHLYNSQTKAQAEQHAQALIRSRVAKGERPQPLLVVEVVSVVGPKPMEVDVTPAQDYPDVFGTDVE